MLERSTLRALARDALGLAGIGGVTYGAWLIYKPAGFVIVGLFALAMCVLLSRTAA